MQNVRASAANTKRSNKYASLWLEAYNFRSTPNGIMRTIWFSNWNFRVFHVNGKHPWPSLFLHSTIPKRICSFGYFALKQSGERSSGPIRSKHFSETLSIYQINLKPAAHLAIFYADRGEFDRKRFMQTQLAVFSPIAAMWHFNLVPGFIKRCLQKSHVIKSLNLIGWFYWWFAAMSAENRGNGHTWRMPASLIADIWHARYRRFFTPIVAIGV